MCQIKQQNWCSPFIQLLLIFKKISLQFIGSSISSNSEGQKISDECIDAKRRKVGTGEIGVKSSNAVESKSTPLSSIDGSFLLQQQN